jgi:hypothetical protein
LYKSFILEEFVTLPNFEVVRVVDPTHVIDVFEKIFSYQTPSGEPLEVGSWYIVEWPVIVPNRRFDASARYSGPFPTELVARLKFEERRAMGMWDAHAARSRHTRDF